MCDIQAHAHHYRNDVPRCQIGLDLKACQLGILYYHCFDEELYGIRDFCFFAVGSLDFDFELQKHGKWDSLDGKFGCLVDSRFLLQLDIECYGSDKFPA